jgi:hypothetical protein
MSPDATISLEPLDAALARAAPTLSDSQQRLAVTIYRRLATGRPVTVLAAAAESGADTEDVERTLGSWPGVFRDDESSVIGFWGLALAEMLHRLRVAEANLFAWCAWDPLFLAHILGPMDVATVDPISGVSITYRIDAAGTIRHISHPDAVLSFLRPERRWDDDVMATFCHYVLQFTDPETARRWTAAHPGTFTISQADGIELARRHVERTFGAAVLPRSLGASPHQQGSPGG